MSGVRLGSCALVEPSRNLAEEYGVVVGHTLVDASSWAASVLMINPNAEEVVLPSFTCVGKLVPVSAVSVALADPGLPDDGCVVLPDHLEEFFWDLTLRWGKLVGGCCVSSSIGISSKIRMAVCWFCRILSAICERLCGTGGTVGVTNTERRPLCVDRSTTNGV